MGKSKERCGWRHVAADRVAAAASMAAQHNRDRHPARRDYRRAITDNIGQPDYNVRLSEARAEAVKAWLMAHGVAAARVASRGYGDPLVANDTDAQLGGSRGGRCHGVWPRGALTTGMSERPGLQRPWAK